MQHTTTKAPCGRHHGLLKNGNPHVCGEYAAPIAEAAGELGSPPRVWGILSQYIVNLDMCRFTPTCVGNTAVGLICQTFHAVHPHVCGEYLHKLSISGRDGGSPPRVWGILTAWAIPGGQSRFTPTCVGNTSQIPPQFHNSTVHPHVCGEYFRNTWCFWLSFGSPPRVWGIPVLQWDHHYFRRFTPTCVGNTSP